MWSQRQWPDCHPEEVPDLGSANRLEAENNIIRSASRYGSKGQGQRIPPKKEQVVSMDQNMTTKNLGTIQQSCHPIPPWVKWGLEKGGGMSHVKACLVSKKIQQ